MKHIVIYRPHGKPQMETKYYGPFEDYIEADDFLCTLPAIGYQFTQEEHDHPGCKYVQELASPDDRT